MSTEKELRGRILKTSNHPDGTSRIVLDNGPVNTVTIHCFSEQLPGLLGTDTHDVLAHLMSRGPNHFRRKSKR